MNDIEMLEDHIITLEKKIKELNDIIAGYEANKKSLVTKKKEDKFKLSWPKSQAPMSTDPAVYYGSADQLGTLTRPGSIVHYSNDPVVLGQEHGVTTTVTTRSVRG